MFNERLKEYRNKLNLNKRQMAKKLEQSESYYNLIESGERNPSSTILNKLFSISGLDEAFWLHGINIETHSNDKFKSLEKTLDTILELNVINSLDELFDDNNYPVDSLGKLLVEALKEDIKNYQK